MIKLNPNDTVGIIAGGGDAPKSIITRLKEQNINYFVIAIKDNADPELLKDSNHEWMHLGELKKAFRALKQHNVSHISFIGSIKRPSISSLKLDSEAALVIIKLGLIKFTGGDNKLLSTVLNLFESKGFQILPPEIISPELVTPKGILGKIKPSKSDIKDIERGMKILDTLGELDVGQAIVVEKEYVLGIEAAEGTNNLIIRCKSLKREKSICGVVVKTNKTGQDRRIDLPAIGVNTIDEIKNSGFKGIAIKSQESIIIDIKNVIKKADKNNIFIVGI